MKSHKQIMKEVAARQSARKNGQPCPYPCVDKDEAEETT